MSAASWAVGTAIFGFGSAVMVPTATTTVINALPSAKAGDASAVNQLSRQVGAAFGVAMIGSVFATSYGDKIESATSSLTTSQASEVTGSISGAISLQELETGVLLAERRDGSQGAILRDWLDGHVVRAFAERIVPVDAHVAVQAAAFHVPDPASVRDTLIGATAMVHDMAVVTRNSKDFKRFVGVEVIDPWT